MPGANGPNYTQLDADQVIQRVFNEAEDRLRVDAEITAVVSGPFEVAIDASTDSISSWIRDSAGSAITLGQKTKAQSIPVVFPSDVNISATIAPGTEVGTIESGTVSTAYDEVTSVANGVITTIVTYAALGESRMKFIEVSGTNIATYTAYVNGDVINKKRTYFGNMDNRFDFTKGYILSPGDIVTVDVLHTQPSLGEFNAFILTLVDT